MDSTIPTGEKGSFFMKVCIIGDGGVGKTSLIERLVGKGFHSTYVITIGADITTYTTVIDGEQCRFQFWDLAGQQRFNAVRTLYYRGSHGGILVFDRTRPVSLANLEHWRKELFRFVGHEIPVMILGNKCDLKNNIDPALLKEFIQKSENDYPMNPWEIPYLDTSAKTGQGVPLAFEVIGRSIQKFYETYSNID
ncbi:MAG: GTP-binding protein [Candidatus Hodarchaeota archaeon]